MKSYEATQYPRIFKDTYWGEFTVNDRDDPTIFSNRNNFVEQYNILKRVPTPKFIFKYIYGITDSALKLDHLESYTTLDRNYILLSSPYDMSENCHNAYINDGWTSIHKLYTSYANSYIKYFPFRR